MSGDSSRLLWDYKQHCACFFHKIVPSFTITVNLNTYKDTPFKFKVILR